MKRKFILLPITLTALAPAISLVACNKPESEYKDVEMVYKDDVAIYFADGFCYGESKKFHFFIRNLTQEFIDIVIDNNVFFRYRDEDGKDSSDITVDSLLVNGNQTEYQTGIGCVFYFDIDENSSNIDIYITSNKNHFGYFYLA